VAKVEVPMAPMIDVVFQLLIFFMLTLKILPPEGDFNINMPIGAPSTSNTEILTPDIKIRLIANRDGSLADMRLGQNSLGNDPDFVFQRLNNEVLKMIGRPGNPLTKDIEVEIDADHELHYEYTMKTVGAVMGKFNPATEEVIPYIQKVKFAPPRLPRG
jgi:biopolymer transport protein ExbD